MIGTQPIRNREELEISPSVATVMGLMVVFLGAIVTGCLILIMALT